MSYKAAHCTQSHDPKCGLCGEHLAFNWRTLFAAVSVLDRTSRCFKNEGIHNDVDELQNVALRFLLMHTHHTPVADLVCTGRCTPEDQK